MITKSEKETKAFAKALLARGVRIFALQGELGSGKTTFVQGLGKALGVRERITSPTFIIMNVHRTRTRQYPYTRLIHVDAYRIRAKDARALHIREVLRDSRAVVAVEWAEELRRIIPKSAAWLVFSHRKSQEERSIIRRAVVS